MEDNRIPWAPGFTWDKEMMDMFKRMDKERDDYINSFDPLRKEAPPAALPLPERPMTVSWESWKGWLQSNLLPSAPIEIRVRDLDGVLYSVKIQRHLGVS